MTSPALRIEALPPGTSHDSNTMRTLTDLVNEVYATAEHGLWLPGTTRTNVDEMTAFTRAGEIVVARWGDDIVGSIRVRRLDAGTAETGMLVAHPGHRNLGIGRQLRRHVTAMLRQAGVKTLQIELLVPRDWTPESKEFMARWNERSGYAIVRKGAFDAMYPELATRLATPCDFIIYEKAL
ncbi:MAG: GNAT family N-acetyltransferase [Mycobacterium sp.]